VVDFSEILLIGVVALLLFGPDKLPEYIRQLGSFYAEIKKAQRELELEFNKAVDAAAPKTTQPSATVVEIARKMHISVEGKSEERLLAEIDSAISKNAATAPEAGKV
jgi:sec-independent protein translocase protein TatA